MPAHTHHAGHRIRRIGMAVGASLISKVGSVVLQLIAIPVAVRVLGTEMFGVYAALTIMWACASLTGIAGGPGLTKALARVHATGDRESEQIYLTTALALLAMAAVLAGALVYCVLTFIPSTTLFGAGFARHQSLIHACAPLLAFCVAAETFLSVVERTQAGYQELHRSNLWGAAGNLTGGVLLLVGIHRYPTVPFLILSVSGMYLVCRLANFVQLFGWQRRYLIGRPFGFCPSKARELIRDGFALTSAQAIAPLLLREGCKLVASHLGGPVAAGIYAVLNQIATSIGGFIFMFTAPLWPALMDAAARHDYAWFNTARRRLWAAVLAYVGLAGILLTLFGSWLIERWFGGQIHISSAMFLAFACYFLALSWEHVNYVCLTGLGVIVMPAALTVGEAVCALCAGWIGMQQGGIAGLLWGQCIVLLCVSGWFFPYSLLRYMRPWRHGGSAPLAVAAGKYVKA